MRMYYDQEVDVLQVELATVRRPVTREIAPGVTGDFDAKGRLVGVEILGASKLYPRDALAEVAALDEEWLTLAEAEAMAAEEGESVKATTWRVLINGDRIPEDVKRKEAGSWRISRRGVMDYLESRAPSGRPSPGRRVRRTRRK